ncbi:Lar family restriction alleviation protein [Dyadobacter sp. CY327]|uniref:Lar family restriction alleviation protein n=1 Tax=Dyadobacter sp. CY327 TaxID=2907301 RepID=UPI001F20F93A|nr:Lar family restriction alleviation protein [Dyadobacter sp. CY327]MCE7073718.1 Lar family restriction alleviation protein [Dyadobacter sp. CY327]
MSELAETLLPCPFCGEQAEIFKKKSSEGQKMVGYGLYRYGVRCTANLQCGGSNENATSKRNAIEGWNTRAPVAAPVVSREDAINAHTEMIFMDHTSEVIGWFNKHRKTIRILLEAAAKETTT